MPIHPNARRCIHTKLDQTQCGAPAVNHEPYCRFHRELARRRRDMTKLPVLETAADIQLAITETIRALIEGRVERTRGTAILYGLQLAQNGLSLGSFARVTFVGELADVNPAERSVIAPAMEVRQTIEEFEAEQQAEQDRQDAEEKAEAERAAAQAKQEAEAAVAAEKQESERRASYAARVADHYEQKELAATIPPTARELDIAEALRRAPREFLDSIPRDEFGDLRPTYEQQEKINDLAADVREHRQATAKKSPNAETSEAEDNRIERIEATAEPAFAAG